MYIKKTKIYNKIWGGIIVKKITSVCLIFFIVSLPGQALADLDIDRQIDRLVNDTVAKTSWKAQDIHLLASIVHAEARGESYLGKVAVAAVVINRIKSPGFPNTIKEVVYQPAAFTCVSDGQIKLKPGLDSYRAASDAILGADPTAGSLFYLNPATASSSWMQERASQKTAITIGNHVFTK